MPSSMKDVPPEVLRVILFYVAPEDYLKVKLVSKHFSDWAAAEFKWKNMTKAEVRTSPTHFTFVQAFREPRNIVSGLPCSPLKAEC